MSRARKVFLTASELLVGSKWKPADGTHAIVTIDEVVNGLVKYTWVGQSTGKVENYEKSAFMFQVRYTPL